MKSVVVSFGVLLLKIISGKRNNGFYNSNRDLNLLGFVWRIWEEGKRLEIVDPINIDYASSTSRTHELLRCIQIGLLCVQERVEDRPLMSSVMVMLGSETTAISQPKRPGFCVGRCPPEAESLSSTPHECTVNQITLSVIDAREYKPCFGSVVPKTVENFRALCTGEKVKTSSGKPLHYKGTPFRLIISGFVIQGGDIIHGDGKGSESIYGGTFPDENFKIKLSHAGVVAMANTGPNSNGSQFFITTVKASWLEREHVVLGKVIQGMDNVFAIEGGAGTYSGKPRKKVVIDDSGEIPNDKWDEER